MTLKSLRLSSDLQAALSSGHPWLYRNHLPTKHSLVMGDWVRVEAGKASQIGLYDAHGQIAVRFFSSTAIPDQTWVTERVSEALEARHATAELEQNHTTAYRLIFGENDFLPGITADKYGRYVVLRHYCDSVTELLPWVTRALSKQLRLKGIVHKTAQGLKALYGELPPPEVTVLEHNLKFIANLYDGQKTGLFLDHRENRRTLAPYCHARQVLNLFSYSGAFSVYALQAGAVHVTDVDIASQALHDAMRNVQLNGFDPSTHTTITQDCFALLQDYAQAQRRFGVVIIDPPSLAHDKKSRRAAERAYERLNTLALRCTEAGGYLATASCTSQISPEAFRTIVAKAAQRAGVRAQILYEGAHAPDHAIRLGYLEGRYLKFLLLRVLPSL